MKLPPVRSLLPVVLLGIADTILLEYTRSTMPFQSYGERFWSDSYERE